MKHLKFFESNLFERIPITNDDPIEDMEGTVRFESFPKSEFERIKSFFPNLRPHYGPFASDYYSWAPDVEIVTFYIHIEDDDKDEYRLYKTDDYYYIVHMIEWRLDDIVDEKFWKCDTLDGLFQLFKSRHLQGYL